MGLAGLPLISKLLPHDEKLGKFPVHFKPGLQIHR